MSKSRRFMDAEEVEALNVVSDGSLMVKPHDTAEDHLWILRQDGRPLERYMEEFSELSCMVNWPDAPLNACFLKGLDEDMIRYSEPACFFSLVESINLILFLNGSDFEIEEVQERTCFLRPVPSEKHAAWSVHQPPVSSTYPSSGYSPVVLPDPKPKPPRRRATARPRRPKRMAAASPEPPVKLTVPSCPGLHIPSFSLFPHLHSLPRHLPIITHHLHLDFIFCTPFIMDSLPALLVCSYC
ncbi:hypothetical protein DPX16_23772 [Anabarilius grahami]|uniref:Retrotransposon gag domain-containing protein n=1 Tax=Anabarilius grahami TaxID=495550 RepID=A0A3N0ZA16_ANAGA|nr:hypothetical protein DPX16_23772 [Anabarilius grahami]